MTKSRDVRFDNSFFVEFLPGGGKGRERKRYNERDNATDREREDHDYSVGSQGVMMRWKKKVENHRYNTRERELSVWGFYRETPLFDNIVRISITTTASERRFGENK